MARTASPKPYSREFIQRRLAPLVSRPIAAAETPVAVTIASQTSGPAPLPVTYDVTRDATITPPANNGSGSPAWETCIVSVNYGDGTAGTWDHTGLSQNTDRNIQGFHTYESPGTYTMTVDVIYPDGSTFSGEQEITATDPDTVYAAGFDKYVHPTLGDDDTGDGSIGTPWQTLDKAVTELLAAGDVPCRIQYPYAAALSTAAGYSLPARTTPVHFGPNIFWGTGANPVITKSTTGGNILSQNPACHHVRVVDTDLAFSGVSDGFVPGGYGLFLRCTITTPSNGFTTSDSFGGKEYTIVQECNVVTATGYGLYWNYGYRMAIGGCQFDVQDIANAEHQCRPYVTHSSIKHNRFVNGRAGKHQMKLTGYFPTGDPLRTGGTPDFATEAVEYTILSDNIFVDQVASMSYIVALGPQDNAKDQRVFNCVVERNYIKMAAVASISRCIAGWTSYCTYRNNRIDGSASVTANPDGINIARRGLEPVPTGNQVLHNSFFHATAGMDPVVIANIPTSLNNGTFATDAVWTKGTGWTIDTLNSNVAEFAAGAASNLTQASADMITPLTVGRSYSVTYTIVTLAAGSIQVFVGSSGGGTVRSTTGTFTETIVCAGSTDFLFAKSDLASGTLDTASCQEQSQPVDTVVKNNHAMTASGTALLADGGTDTVESGNTRSDVGFTDPANNDWTPTSSILETVTTLAEARDDFVGTVRGAVGAACDSGSTED